MSAAGLGRVEGDQQVLAPWPSQEFRRLDRRQSVIAWTIGLIVGTVVAAAVIGAIVVAAV